MKRNVTTLISRTGETLDCVLYRCGRSDTRESIFALNPHLTQISSVLPEGTRIDVPEGIPTISQKTLPSISLWD